jgi:hypothetical protein
VTCRELGCVVPATAVGLVAGALCASAVGPTFGNTAAIVGVAATIVADILLLALIVTLPEHWAPWLPPCSVCGGRDYGLEEDTEPNPWDVALATGLVTCRSCGAVHRTDGLRFVRVLRDGAEVVVLQRSSLGRWRPVSGGQA